jgi:hypothetical protein
MGADYLVHSIPASTGYVIANNYLVVEAALFGPRNTTVNLSLDNFVLRINGTMTLEAHTPSEVAYSIRNADRGFLNPQRAAGDPNRSPPVGPPTRVPTSPNNSGYDKAPPPPLEQQVTLVALPMGQQKLPVAGTLFFPFKGKTVSIKSLDLIYSDPAGKLTLKLF